MELWLMSTVIKAGETYKLVKQPTTIDLADHLAEADKVVQAAREEAREFVNRARREAAAALKAARDDGYARGHAEGRRAGEEAGEAHALAEARQRFTDQHASLVEALGAALEELDARKRDLLIEARHHLLDFAIAVARRVVHRVGELHPEAAAANLEAALRLVSDRTDVAVRLNPADAAAIQQFGGELFERTRRIEHIAIVEDDSVAPGGCVVRAGDTQIDATIETQMDEMVRVLLGEGLET
jgi:flagellar assembly protein FliH